jgi:hypothetical protein
MEAWKHGGSTGKHGDGEARGRFCCFLLKPAKRGDGSAAAKRGDGSAAAKRGDVLLLQSAGTVLLLPFEIYPL